MTDVSSGRAAEATPAYRGEPETTGWVGWVFFAGVLMIMDGLFSVITGLVALFKDDYYLVGKDGLVVTIDYTAWGWIHLLVGVLVALAGLGVIAGQTWARVVGVVMAILSALANFAFLAAYPVWSTIIIVIDVFVVYALVVHGRETRALR
jgi:hypothetical protein